MRVLFAACLGANLLVLMAVIISGAKSLSSVKGNKAPKHQAKLYADKMMVCNLIQDSHVNEAITKLEAKLEILIALVNKTSDKTQIPQRPLPTQAIPVFSCKEQYDKHKSKRSQVTSLTFSSHKIPVYCHMGNFGCGDGGWTLAMKIDGNKKTFHYNSHFWSDRNGYNLAGGKTGFDFQETKLPTYWEIPFSKICLGMKIGHQMKFIVINKQANSLYSLIADGKYRATSLGRNTWKSLIGSQASLQRNCNKEGFNAVGANGSHAKARIGIIGNEQNDCSSCDSRIGFGTGGHPNDSAACGNEAKHSSDNGDKHIATMGYILVQ